MKPTHLEILREILAECESDAATASDSARWFHLNRRDALQYAIDQIKASPSVKARSVDSEGGGDLGGMDFDLVVHCYANTPIIGSGSPEAEHRMLDLERRGYLVRYYYRWNVTRKGIGAADCDPEGWTDPAHFEGGGDL